MKVEPTSFTGSIYALVDPRDGVTFYVGQTAGPIICRMRTYLSEARCGGGDERGDRIRAIVADGGIPLVVELERVPLGELSAAEKRWISTKRSEVGGKLTNKRSGGATPRNAPRLPSYKWSGVRASAETLARIDAEVARRRREDGGVHSRATVVASLAERYEGEAARVEHLHALDREAERTVGG